MNASQTCKTNHYKIKKICVICVYLRPIFLLLLLLTACSQSEQVPTPTPLPTPVAVEKPTYTVQRGTVVKTLEFTGRVSPVTEQELFFKTNGYVRAVYVKRDDTVQAGDLLAELEIGDLENQLAQTQVALQTAETTLAQAQQGAADALAQAQIALETAKIRQEQAQSADTSSAVAIAHVRLQQAQSALADAQEAYNQAWEPARDWELYMTDPTGVPPYTGPSLKDQLEAERDATEHGLAAAQASLQIAQAEHNQAIAARNSHQYDLQTLAQDVALAELRVSQLERGVDPLLELNVEKAQLDIQRTQDQMAEAQLVAPFDGQLFSLNIKPGSLVEAFKAALVLGDSADLEITADLGASDLNQLSVGQPATVRLRGRPEQDLSGIIRQLPYPYSGGAATVDTADDDTAVRVALDAAHADVELERGELATVVIVLEQKDNVLWLPPAALRAFQGRDFIVIQNGDRQQRVDVRRGIESEERVEILEGVEEGQIVVGQ